MQPAGDVHQAADIGGHQCVGAALLDARDFPIEEGRTTLEYGFAKIAERDYLLPLRATVRMREGKTLTRNEVEFRLYRKFTAEASIAFDAAELEARPDEKPQKDPPP